MCSSTYLIPLPLYAKIKDNYCIGYFGESQEIIDDLIKARPIIEKELPGLRLYICCADEKELKEERMFAKSELASKIKEFAYFREIVDETAMDLLKESDIPFDPNIFKNK